MIRKIPPVVVPLRPRGQDRGASRVPRNVPSAAGERAHFTWEAARLRPPSPDAWLLQAADSPDLADALRSLSLGAPTLYDCARRLGLYLTPGWPDAAGLSLYQSSVRAALVQAGAPSRGERLFHGLFVAAFLKRLLFDRLGEVAAFELIGRDLAGGTHRWQPFSQSLADWADSRGIHEVQGWRSANPPAQVTVRALRHYAIAATVHPVDAESADRLEGLV
jgi:hypothetical protein